MLITFALHACCVSKRRLSLSANSFIGRMLMFHTRRYLDILRATRRKIKQYADLP